MSTALGVMKLIFPVLDVSCIRNKCRHYKEKIETKERKNIQTCKHKQQAQLAHTLTMSMHQL